VTPTSGKPGALDVWTVTFKPAAAVAASEAVVINLPASNVPNAAPWKITPTSGLTVTAKTSLCLDTITCDYSSAATVLDTTGEAVPVTFVAKVKSDGSLQLTVTVAADVKGTKPHELLAGEISRFTVSGLTSPGYALGSTVHWADLSVNGAGKQFASFKMNTVVFGFSVTPTSTYSAESTTYTLAFTSTSALYGQDTITVKYTGLTAAPTGGAISGLTLAEVADATTMVYTIAGELYDEKKASGAAVSLALTGVTNPTAAAYTFTISTSRDAIEATAGFTITVGTIAPTFAPTAPTPTPTSNGSGVVTPNTSGTVMTSVVLSLSDTTAAHVKTTFLPLCRDKGYACYALTDAPAAPGTTTAPTAAPSGNSTNAPTSAPTAAGNSSNATARLRRVLLSANASNTTSAPTAAPSGNASATPTVAPSNTTAPTFAPTVTPTTAATAPPTFTAAEQTTKATAAGVAIDAAGNLGFAIVHIKDLSFTATTSIVSFDVKIVESLTTNGTNGTTTTTLNLTHWGTATVASLTGASTSMVTGGAGGSFAIGNLPVGRTFALRANLIVDATNVTAFSPWAYAYSVGYAGTVTTTPKMTSATVTWGALDTATHTAVTKVRAAAYANPEDQSTGVYGTSLAPTSKTGEVTTLTASTAYHVGVAFKTTGFEITKAAGGELSAAATTSLWTVSGTMAALTTCADAACTVAPSASPTAAGGADKDEDKDKELKMKLKLNYTEYCGTETLKTSFLASFKTELSKVLATATSGVEADVLARLSNFKAAPGSIIVSFTIKAGTASGATTTEAFFTSLKAYIADPSTVACTSCSLLSVVNIDTAYGLVDVTPTTAPTDAPTDAPATTPTAAGSTPTAAGAVTVAPTSAPTSSDDDTSSSADNGNQTLIIVIVAVVVLVVCAGAIAFFMYQKKKEGEAPTNKGWQHVPPGQAAASKV